MEIRQHALLLMSRILFVVLNLRTLGEMRLPLGVKHQTALDLPPLKTYALALVLVKIQKL
jgi:hypothetical protein